MKKLPGPPIVASGEMQGLRRRLATALKHSPGTFPIPRFDVDGLKVLASTPLQDDFTSLNRLRSGSPEAYYHWLETASLP